ncbi:MAG: hypothetical protein CMG64_01065 [Candidatus Marinimicrobia bacterium]|nr:hypothetical protein [Candidatus Neomarinimicrobiota bacterium]|tara:strand:+ start:1159 stop:1806 length:648 start_codon:yes stop_codon:yes gene_type:complete
MNIQTFQGGFDKNLSYVVWCEKTRIAAIIDASVEINPIIEFINNKNLILSKILITHTHHDHIYYLKDLIELYPTVNIYCYKNAINMNINFKGLTNNEMIAIGNQIIIAIYTPGHYADSMCFWNQNIRCIFTGDTLFVTRPGRTISPQSDIHDLYKSLYNKIFTLPENTTIYPGHHYGHVQNISLKNNKITSKFFNCKSFQEFNQEMIKFEKNKKK